MKRAALIANFPELISHKSQLSATAMASNNTAAIRKAVHKLLRHPELRHKKISTIKMTISISSVDPDEIERAIQEQLAKEEKSQPKEEPEPSAEKAFVPTTKPCKDCAAPVVMMLSKRGLMMPVEPDSITQATYGDHYFPEQGHVSHLANCAARKREAS